MTKIGQIKKQGTVAYQGKIMTLHAIANAENLTPTSLNKYYKIYHDIDKAVLVAKTVQANTTLTQPKIKPQL